MKSKENILKKIEELKTILKTEQNKENLEQIPCILDECEYGIKYLEWVVE